MYEMDLNLLQSLKAYPLHLTSQFLVKVEGQELAYRFLPRARLHHWGQSHSREQQVQSSQLAARLPAPLDLLFQTFHPPEV